MADMSTSSPLVSVVIPTFNRAGDIRRAVESVLTQTFGDFEILVMDDGSTDDTRDVVRQIGDPRIYYDWKPNTGGPAAPRNRGIRQARGRFVAFLDADDWWLPQKLEYSLRYLEAGADIVYHDLRWVTKSRQRVHLRRAHTRQLKAPAFLDLLRNGNALNNSSVVVRKSLLEEVGGQPEEPVLVAAEDYDTWLRIALLTERFKRIPGVLGYYWVGGGNISSPHRMLRYIDRLEERHGATFARLSGGGCPCWLHYGRGRCHYLLGNYDQARLHLRQVRRAEAAWSIRFKTSWMLAHLRLLDWGRRAARASQQPRR